MEVFLGGQEFVQRGKGIHQIVRIANELGQEAVHIQFTVSSNIFQDTHFEPRTSRGVAEGLCDLPEDSTSFAVRKIPIPEEEPQVGTFEIHANTMICATDIAAKRYRMQAKSHQGTFHIIQRLVRRDHLRGDSGSRRH